MFQVKDSGNRQEWNTGSKRDTNEGKPRYDLISVHALTRLAEHMAKGAKKYGERNWEQGQPTGRYYESALRHLYMYLTDDSEDHLSAVLYNVMAIIHTQTEIEAGLLPEYLDDVYRRLPSDTDKIQEASLIVKAFGVSKVDKPNPKDYIDSEHIETRVDEMLKHLKYCTTCGKDTLPTKESALAPEHCTECEVLYE